MRGGEIFFDRKLWLLAASLLVAFVGGVELVHRYNYGRFVRYGLHVDVTARDADIGIPGITKMYSARLSNFGLLPVKLDACYYLTDAFSSGTAYPYVVQRWDAATRSWQTVADTRGDDFCKPAPLSRINAEPAQRLLLPGDSVEVMEGEATAAQEPFRRGDLARFAVFRNNRRDVGVSEAVASEPFEILEQVEGEKVNYRVAH